MGQPQAFVEIAYAPELAVLTVAFFAILILGGLWLFIELLAKAFSQIPVVGPPVAKFLNHAARWARNAIIATLHGSLHAAGQMFAATSRFLRNIVGDIRDTLQVLDGEVGHVIYTVIPREIRGARKFASKVASRSLVTSLEYGKHVEKEARKWADGAYSRAHGEITAARRQLLKTIQVSNGQLLRIIQSVQARADAQFSKAQADARRMFGQAEADSAAQAKAAGQQAVKTAAANADQAAASGWRQHWAEITAGVGAAAAAAESAMPDLARQLRTIIQTEPATLAQAETAAANAIPPVMTALEKCVIPDCANLNQLSRSLHSLADIAFFATLIAWLIQMVKDPVAWAHETYTLLKPAADGELAIVRGVLGL